LLAVIARGMPSASRAVITVTPVAKEPRVLRSWRVSNSVTGRLPRRSVVVVVVVAERWGEGNRRSRPWRLRRRRPWAQDGKCFGQIINTLCAEMGLILDPGHAARVS